MSGRTLNLGNEQSRIQRKSLNFSHKNVENIFYDLQAESNLEQKRSEKENISFDGRMVLLCEAQTLNIFYILFNYIVVEE